MAKTDILPASDLRQLLEYTPETGKLFWKMRTTGQCKDERARKIFNTQFAGKEAFTCRMGSKHLQGRINREAYLAHRVIWALVKGAWPAGQIDHINGNPIDNRMENLREVAGPENQRNMKRCSVNTSGATGVDWSSARGKWRARAVGPDGADVHLGRFVHFEDAVAARKAAEQRFGYHPNHGREALV